MLPSAPKTDIDTYTVKTLWQKSTANRPHLCEDSTFWVSPGALTCSKASLDLRIDQKCSYDTPNVTQTAHRFAISASAQAQIDLAGTIGAFSELTGSKLLRTDGSFARGFERHLSVPFLKQLGLLMCWRSLFDHLLIQPSPHTQARLPHTSSLDPSFAVLPRLG